jgi:hypothetical protein
MLRSSPRSPTKRDVVVGIAQDTDPKNLAVFCASLREVSPQSDLVLFMNTPISGKNLELIKQYDVTLVEYNLQNLPIPEQHMSTFHPSTLRWPLIKQYFDDKAVKEKYNRVWLADVRDTYFQSDPFAMMAVDTKGFFTFSGVESVSIEQCGWNGGWVKDCFGPDVLSRIGKQKIICSGVSMGDVESVYSYLVLMNDIISNKKTTQYGQVSKFPQCERNGVDQVLSIYSSHRYNLLQLSFIINAAWKPTTSICAILLLLLITLMTTIDCDIGGAQCAGAYRLHSQPENNWTGRRTSC